MLEPLAVVVVSVIGP